MSKDKECIHKDTNGNACWNCETGMGKCGEADKEETRHCPNCQAEIEE